MTMLVSSSLVGFSFCEEEGDDEEKAVSTLKRSAFKFGGSRERRGRPSRQRSSLNHAVVVAVALAVISPSAASSSLSLLSTTAAASAADDPVYGPTTLERAMNRAYNAKVKDGTWARIFGRDSLRDFRADNFCTGFVDGWPLPDVVTGSDLARVLETGVFRCGHNMKTNFATPDGEVLFRAANTSDGGATGAGVEFWNAMVAEFGAMYGRTVTVKWTLYPGSQNVLDAVRTGELDAACAYWQSDGHWTDSTGTKIARGLAFSKQTCPTTVQTEFVWTTLASGIDSWEILVDRINTGQVDTVCVSTPAGSGSETNCQNTLEQFTTSETIRCVGVLDRSFEMLAAGNCSATWTGFPNAQAINASLFQSFAQPAAIARVSFFRSWDLSTKTAATDSDGYLSRAGRYFERTSLEQAVVRAFNIEVSAGSYAAAYGGLAGIESVSFCTGNYQPWVVPKVTPGSDLEFMLDRGVFRCGYTKNSLLATTDGVALLDTIASAVTGRTADFWNNSLIPALGRMFDRDDLTLEWVLHDFDVQTLNSLAMGRIDAACGHYEPDGIWVDGSQVVSRTLAFSAMYCPTLLRTDYIYTLASSTVTTFEELVEAILADRVDQICVAGDITGGAVSNCANTVEEYTRKRVTCKGSGSVTSSPNEDAFRRLSEGVCDAVWGGQPPGDTGGQNGSSRHHRFAQPTVLVPVSLFRTTDVSKLPDRQPPPGASPPDPPANGGQSREDQVTTESSDAAALRGPRWTPVAATIMLMMMLLLSY